MTPLSVVAGMNCAGRYDLASLEVALDAAASDASSFVIISRITNFWTLPVTVIGKVSTNRTYLGILKCVIRPRQKARISSSVHRDLPGPRQSAQAEERL